MPAPQPTEAQHHLMAMILHGPEVRHYKGGRYKIDRIVTMEATGELAITYEAVDDSDAFAGDGTTWCRPLFHGDSPFVDLVETKDGLLPRFAIPYSREWGRAVNAVVAERRAPHPADPMKV